MVYGRLLLALGCLAISLLTFVKAPGLWGWKLAVLATEFGHFVSLVPVGVILWLFLAGQNKSAVFWITFGLCLCSVGLFLKPSVQADRLSASLNERLVESFGGDLREDPFSWLRLFRIGQTSASKFETLVYAKDRTGKDLVLDFYAASAATTNDPCVVVIHGGGWNSGSRDEIVGFNHWLANRGFAVASIEYGLAPDSTWPSQLNDVRNAVAYLRSQSERLGLDENRIALFGRSAGGQIATAAATEALDLNLRCVAAFYAPHDLEFAWEFGKEDDVLNSLDLLRSYLGGPPQESPKAYHSASAYLKDSTAIRRVPTLLVHGKLDTLVWVKQSQRYAEKLKAANARFLYLELPWATHGFEFNQNGPAGQLALHALEHFLDREMSER